MTVPVIHLASIDSTNDEAKRRLAAGRLTRPCAIAAEAQTAGRGTRGRAWASPAGAGLYVTYVYPGLLAVAPSESASITLAAGHACARAIETVTGVRVDVKPVNDLYLGGRKLGGILTESVTDGGRLRDLVIGVGVNLARAERGVDRAVPTAALEEAMAPAAWAALDRPGLLDAVVAGLDGVVRPRA